MITPFPERIAARRAARNEKIRGNIESLRSRYTAAVDPREREKLGAQLFSLSGTAKAFGLIPDLPDEPKPLAPIGAKFSTTFAARAESGAPKAASATPVVPPAVNKIVEKLRTTDSQNPPRNAGADDDNSAAAILATFDAMPSATTEQKIAKHRFYAKHEEVLTTPRQPAAHTVTPAMASRISEREKIFAEFEQLAGAEKFAFYRQHESVLSRPINPRRS